MINDMLDLSKLDSKDVLKIEKFETSDLINETLSRVAHILEKENIKLIYNPSQNFVEGDRTKIGQVLYNLILNAINFVGENNSIWINQQDNGNTIRIEIQDHGIGISEEDLPYIFDRYYKTNDKYRKNGVSTGLGLAIVKSILEKHGFSYGVESKKGEGTKFWFEIVWNKKISYRYHITVVE